MGTRIIYRNIILYFLIIIMFLIIGGCNGISNIYYFTANLNIKNETSKTIFITPIGVNASKQYYLLPVLTKKGEHYYYSNKKKDFKLDSFSSITITFDHDDIQFSGIILVSDHQNLHTVVLTKDIHRDKYYYPPLESLYILREENLNLSLSEIEDYMNLFRKFQVP